MNLFLRELKAYRRSTLIWAASLSLLVIFFMALYPAFTSDVEALKKVLANFPKIITSGLGLSLDTFFSVYGFYGYLLSFAVLTASIQAMNLGAGVLSKETAGKTADFLLTKPVTRQRVVSAKLAAVMTIVVFTNLVFSVASYIAITAATKESFSEGKILLLASTMFLVQLMFVALGVLMSVIIPKIKSVISVSLPTVFAFYIIGTIGDVVGAEQMRYISPFKYYDPIYIVEHNGLETKYVLIEAVFVAVALILSYVIYIRKDIRAAV